MALTELILLLACATAPGRVEGRSFVLPGAGVALDWPSPWTIVIDPKLFRSDLPDLVLEGRAEETLVALSFHPMPGAATLNVHSALDELMLRWPTPPEAHGAGYSLQRLPWCDGAIEQGVKAEDGRLFLRYAWTTPAGLAVLSAWSPSGDPDRALTRDLVCGRPR